MSDPRPPRDFGRIASPQLVQFFDDDPTRPIVYHRYVRESEFFCILPSILPGAGMGLFLRPGVVLDSACRATMARVSRELTFYSPVRLHEPPNADGAFVQSTDYVALLSDPDGEWPHEPEPYCAIDEAQHRSLASFVNNSTETDLFTNHLRIRVSREARPSDRTVHYYLFGRQRLEGPMELFGEYGDGYWLNPAKPPATSYCLNLVRRYRLNQRLKVEPGADL